MKLFKGIKKTCIIALMCAPEVTKGCSIISGDLINVNQIQKSGIECAHGLPAFVMF